MSYYKVCPYCDSNLDPGETCTCKESKDGDLLNRYMEKESAAQSVSAPGKEETHMEASFCRDKEGNN